MQGQEFENLLRRAGFVKTDTGKAASFLGLSRERIYQLLRGDKSPARIEHIEKLEQLIQKRKEEIIRLKRELAAATMERKDGN